MTLAKMLAGPVVVAAMLCAGLAGPATAADARKDVSKDDGLLHITDSLLDLERTIAASLEKRFKVKANLQTRDENPEDLFVIIAFQADETKHQPAINVVIDTQVIGRDKDGKAGVQLVRIAASANLQLKPEKEADIVQLMNRINQQPLPTHAYYEVGRIIIASNQIITPGLPLEKERVYVAFSSVLQTWVAMNKALLESDFIAK